MQIRHSFILVTLSIFLLACAQENTSQDQTVWPEIENTTKPWTRWWWMGNAVDQANLKASLVDFHNAGLGGVEITPIYGVKGEEDHFIDYLSLQRTLTIK